MQFNLLDRNLQGKKQKNMKAKGGEQEAFNQRNYLKKRSSNKPNTQEISSASGNR